MDFTAMRRISREMRNQREDCHEDTCYVRAIELARVAHLSITDNVDELWAPDDRLDDNPAIAAEMRLQAREELVPLAEAHAAAIDRALREVDAFRARLVTLRGQTRAAVDAAILAWEAE